MAAARIKGVLSPVVTPFKRDLSPDVGRFIAHCKWLLSQDCGLAVFGTNSEANSMSADERMGLLDSIVSAGVPTDRMMPGTGACSINEAAKVSAHATKYGVAGVLMLPPFYYKGVPEEGLFRFFSEVVQRVGEQPRTGRAQQPDQHVARCPGLPPQQALHREHHVHEEDHQHRPAATVDGQGGTADAEQRRPQPGVGQGAVAAGAPGVALLTGGLVGGVRQRVDDLAGEPGQRAEGPGDGGGLVVQVGREGGTRADQRTDDKGRPGHGVAEAGRDGACAQPGRRSRQ